MAASPPNHSYPIHHGGSSEVMHGVSATFPPPEVEPDIVLGGLLPIHARNVTKNGPPKCGSLNVERGIHRLEAMIFAVDQINRNPNLLPNITLGMSAYDTCDLYTKALEESLGFVMKSRSKTICELGDTFSTPAPKKGKILAGIVGAASSSVSIQVANLLRLFNLPQISYASTTPDLSDKTKYDFFVRTVPPDNYQARAMVDVVRGLKWTSVFTVHSEGIYGERGIREFSNGAKAANICIAGSYKIEGSNNEMQIDDIISDFGKHEQVRAVILFCTDTDARRLLKGVQKQKRDRHFIWVASDYWGTRKKTIEGLEKYAEGAITISLTEAPYPKFKDYFISLKPGINRTKNYSLAASDVRIDDKVPFLIDAVYAFAYGLNKIYKRMCQAQSGLCQNLIHGFKGKNLRDELFNLTFTGVTGTVSFDKNGNGPGQYDVYRLEYGRYRKVASWNGKLYNATKLFQGGKNGTTPLSHCSSPCEAGYRKKFDTEGSCCWNCERCANDYYVEDETSCKPCQQGQRPNA
ncbi:Metabotropic glutamate receptor 8 [Stylophora pistillata]|uniref:Metabotropic glutamate receptor 8 n=1 Tax=Stylophora pistillata TaxID=50429 RepID=A0A2B4RQV3_STYPI|nr:Metabotropic glutamate receptor 8 [Stylophora pistillata]